MPKYQFKDLVNVDVLQQISTKIYEVAGIPIGVMGNDGVFYAKAGWQRICLQYHRVHPVSKLRCEESDHFIAENLCKNDYTEYKCLNGMTDIATPLLIDGEHIATIFLGQFFYDDEVVDVEYFIEQAKIFEYNEADYIKALKEVPIFSREKVKGILEYYQGLLQNLAESGKLRIELNKALEESKFQEAKIHTFLKSIEDMIFINDAAYCYAEYLSSNNDDLYVPVEEFIGKHIEEVLPKHLASRIIECFKKLDRGITPPPVEYSLEVNEQTRWYSAKITKISGLSDYGYEYMTVVRDITNIKEHEQLIQKMAYFDELTGLYNRSMFYEFLNKVIEDNKRTRSECAIIFLDLDNFKKINDTRGHYVGDQLLKIIGQRLKDNLRQADIIARLGGDEFTLLINNVDSKIKVIEFLERLIRIINEPVVVDTVPLYITASIGVSFYPFDGGTIDELLKNADAAMYRAKENGRNCYQLYNEEINNQLIEKFKLENELREALTLNKGLMVYFQPVMLANGRGIRGFEALARWQHKNKFIVPDIFIPIAEEVGLINALGHFVLECSCRFAAFIEKSCGLKMITSVNISIEQLNNPGFISEVCEIIEKTGVRPGSIEFEVTESQMIEELDRVVAVLEEIKSLGIRIALDDFGTGYSSLGYIKSLPLDTLKIDRLFIKDVCTNEVDRHILEVIVSLARKLELEVISEGVETQEQVELLNKGLTDYIQGYYYYKPMPETKAKELIEEKNEKI